MTRHVRLRPTDLLDEIGDPAFALEERLEERHPTRIREPAEHPGGDR
jgi:hypothetical protein